MKTEKEVRNILKTVDKRIAECFRDKAKEYTAAYNKTPEENVELRQAYCQRLVVLQDVAKSMGYDWHRDIYTIVNRSKPSTVSIFTHKVTEGF